jgi:hypothetical protein
MNTSSIILFLLISESVHRCKKWCNHRTSSNLSIFFLCWRNYFERLVCFTVSSWFVFPPLRPRITVNWSGFIYTMLKCSYVATLSTAEVQWIKSSLSSHAIWVACGFYTGSMLHLNLNDIAIKCWYAGIYLCLQRSSGSHIKQNGLSPPISQRCW